MKKTYLTILVLVTIAGIIFGSLYHIGGYFRGRTSGGNKRVEEIVWTSEDTGIEKIKRVEIRAKYGDIEVRGGAKPQAVYTGRERTRFNCELRGDTLYLEQVNSGANVNLGIAVNNPTALSLVLPENSAEVFIYGKTEMGEVELCDLKAAGCDMETDMGTVRAKNCEIGRAELSTDMGDVEVVKTNFTELDCSTELGSVKIEAAQDLADYEMELSTDLGSVNVNGEGRGKEYKQPGGAGKVKAETDLGEVELSF